MSFGKFAAIVIGGSAGALEALGAILPALPIGFAMPIAIVLHDSLCRKGFLGLGLKETLRFTRHAAAFTDLVPEARLYQKI